MLKTLVVQPSAMLRVLTQIQLNGAFTTLHSKPISRNFATGWCRDFPMNLRATYLWFRDEDAGAKKREEAARQLQNDVGAPKLPRLVV